jgi:hypothetical protein
MANREDEQDPHEVNPLAINERFKKIFGREMTQDEKHSFLIFEGDNEKEKP